jgi:hypothetical protein
VNKKRKSPTACVLRILKKDFPHETKEEEEEEEEEEDRGSREY